MFYSTNKSNMSHKLSFKFLLAHLIQKIQSPISTSAVKPWALKVTSYMSTLAHCFELKEGISKTNT